MFRPTRLYQQRPKITVPKVEIPSLQKRVFHKKAKEAKSLQELLQMVRVKDFVKGITGTGFLIDMDEDRTVLEGITTMAKKNIGSIIIRSSGRYREHIGMFTESDYREKIVLQGRNSASTLLRDAMTKYVVAVSPHFTLDEVIKLMWSNNYRHLPMISGNSSFDGDTSILGIISSRDVLIYLVEALRASNLSLEVTAGEALSNVTHRHTMNFVLDEDQNVLKALEVMSEHHFSSVLLHKATKITGIFTERDYLTRVFLQGYRSAETPLKKVMTHGIITAHASSPLEDVLKLMTTHKLRNIPIVPVSGEELDYTQREPLLIATDMDLFKWFMRKGEDYTIHKDKALQEPYLSGFPLKDLPPVRRPTLNT